MSDYTPPKNTPQANPNKKYGIVVSEYNKNYTDEMLEIAKQELQKAGATNIEILHVPGAFELPLGAKQLIQNNCDAVLTLGVVIRGETSHYDHVCNVAAQGIMQVSLGNTKPVIFGVLTCENEKQVKSRINKVYELVAAMLQMVKIT